jgi:hypothetical protein
LKPEKPHGHAGRVREILDFGLAKLGAGRLAGLARPREVTITRGTEAERSWERPATCHPSRRVACLWTFDPISIRLARSCTK